MSKETQRDLLFTAKLLLAWAKPESESTQSQYLKDQFKLFSEIIEKANSEYIASVK